MKLIEGIKHEGLPFEIPDASRDELPQFFVEMGYKVGAEVGVYRGKFTEKFCRKGLKMYAIDPWIGYKGAGRSEQTQDMQDFNYFCAKEALSPYKDCELIRKASMEAVQKFGDESLDFVYIDGDHRFKFIAEDLSEWYLKIRKGGAIAGHDYFCTSPGANNVICQVQPVVDAFVKTFGIENFYTFGRLKRSEMRTNADRYLSWMFVKP